MNTEPNKTEMDANREKRMQIIENATEEDRRELEEIERRGQEMLAEARAKMDKMLANANKALERYKKKAEKQNKKDAIKDRKTVEKKIAALEKGVPHAQQTEPSLKAQETFFNQLVDIERLRRQMNNTLENATTDEERETLRESLKKLDDLERNTMGELRMIMRHGENQPSIGSTLIKFHEAHPELHPTPKEEELCDEAKEMMKSWKTFETSVLGRGQTVNKGGEER